MKKIMRGIGLTIALFVMCGYALNSLADEHGKKGDKQEILAEMWVMVPKEGQMEQLEQAIREHSKFRQSKQDSRKWNIYSPVLGHKLDRIAVRATGFTWQDMDGYRDWAEKQGINKHWMETASQYVDHYHHYLSVIDHENSHWGSDVKYNYVGVTSYVPKVGHWGDIEKDKKALADAAKAEKWPYHWAFASQVGGRGDLTLAVPYQNWAAMAPPEQKFSQVLAKNLGNEEKAKELMKNWASHFEEISYNIWALRNDLMQ
ncbi:hypothetical protein OPS25_01480 [Alteromonas ponticola]|uniref:Uncharacterized protein n=1 Tax=Alteromonas aquimaris TaxID=2998417 RepID=A0ABT3P340_9ALTE|nr:hypothetical protein [Alteromonas aquimaris]MCW8107174.1 hypothetical protein [Alteromonas aquimaris]